MDGAVLNGWWVDGAVLCGGLVDGAVLTGVNGRGRSCPCWMWGWPADGAVLTGGELMILYCFVLVPTHVLLFVIVEMMVTEV